MILIQVINQKGESVATISSSNDHRLLFFTCPHCDFQMTVEKPKPKQLLRPITKGAGSAMNQSKFLAIICNSLQAREKSHVHGAIGFGFDSHWSKNWRESFKPITKRSNRNHIITFDSHLKTGLCYVSIEQKCCHFPRQ